MIRIKDIAKMAGVSPSTVSNVLNGKSNAGEDTRQKILKICAEHSYYPNVSGKNLRKAGLRTNTILFNFSDFDRSFYLKIIKGINDYVTAQEYDLIISTNKSCQKFMNPGLTDGCIMLDHRMRNEDLLRYSREDYPIIALDRKIEAPFIKSILVDNYQSMYKMMEEVIKRGYRKFAFLGGIENTEDTIERYQAFRDVLDGHGIPFGHENYISGDYKEKSGIRAAKILMLGEQLPEILVCANDSMALGAIKAFRNNGFHVPEHIAVTGFDDIEMAGLAGLTTVAVPNYERGYLAAQYLISILGGEAKHDSYRIPSKIMWRNTVRENISKKFSK